MRNLLMTGLAVLATLLGATSARAEIWTEMGDAGQLPATAQVVASAIPNMPLTGIMGATSSATDVDMYQIFISNPAAFSATTVGQPGTLLDTQLFLFNAAGLGVEANDDASLTNFRSILAAGNPNSPTTAGIYFLAITSFNNDPTAPGGLRIFPDPSGIGMTVGPTGPGGGEPVSGWANAQGAAGTYQIAITGAQFVLAGAVIPEPGSVTLLGIGAVSLIGYGWRRRKIAA